MILTLQEIHNELMPASFVGDSSRLGQYPQGVSTDSRLLAEGDLFFALRGEKFDGHEFAIKVQPRAIAAVVEESWFEAAGRPAGNFLVVPDALFALQACATCARRRWARPLVAIGGSNGKTTTKDLAYAVLSQAHAVLRTQGNLNNHIGVPLTLGGLKNEHTLAVVEIGTNHFGEIARLCEIAEPTLGLITNIGREHLEFFGDLAGVARAEFELYDYLAAAGGMALINMDDRTLRAAAWPGLKTLTFGFAEGAQVRGVHLALGGDGCATFEVEGVRIRVPIAGAHQAQNALAAVAAGKALGVSVQQARAGIEASRPASKRMQIEHIAGVTFINDAYNANPDSMRAALETLMAMPAEKGGRRVAVLGDMLELGPASAPAHREIGERLNQLHIDAVFAFGEASRSLIDVVDRRRVETALHFERKDELSRAFGQFVRAGDVVLVKGSRGKAMEEVLESFRRMTAPAA